MNCFDCGRLAKVPTDSDSGSYGTCSKCGGVVGRIYGLVNDRPKDIEAANFEYQPNMYRISPCFIAIFSDDQANHEEPHPKIANFVRKSQDFLWVRFKDRLTQLTPYTSPNPPHAWKFLAECPFVSDPSRYHVWRRIAMGDWEALDDHDGEIVCSSAQIAAWFHSIYNYCSKHGTTLEEGHWSDMMTSFD